VAQPFLAVLPGFSRPSTSTSNKKTRADPRNRPLPFCGCGRERNERFGILLYVIIRKQSLQLIFSFALLSTLSLILAWRAYPQTPSGTSVGTPIGTSAGTPAPPGVPQAMASTNLNVVVLDPAHGGTDLGARGTEGIRESEVVLQFATQVRRALEAQGFQVVQTREGNENPSFDDRSARANAVRGAVFISLHVASTGLAGTARVYSMPDLPSANDGTGLILWDRAQAPFTSLSHKLGDLVQMELARRFKGSPVEAQLAPVRQLRTTAAPAIAVEISSVSVADRASLDRMIPGVADAIARAVTSFKPSYVVPVIAPAAAGVHP
jgi:N-acetylmuramoyl-L-alanine amidase